MTTYTLEPDLHFSHEIMPRTKLTHTYKYYKIIHHHYTTNTTTHNPQPRFKFIKAKYTSSSFLNVTYIIKSTYLHGILRNYDPVRQMYIFCPLNNSFSNDESRPLLVQQEYIQPTEVTILEYIPNTKLNHKLYKVFQNTCHEFSLQTEELKIITALELFWPLLKTKNIISMLNYSN